MKRADRRRWREATGLADLGELFVAWLHGEIAETPAHGGGPDPETNPLTEVLTSVNRAGFVTDNSQLAETIGGETWNTWVEGFATDETLGRIRAAAAGTGLTVTACRGREHGERHGLGTGWQCPGRSARSFWSDSCPRTAGELRNSWYVMVSDPEPGRNELLWGTLARVAGVTMPANRVLRRNAGEAVDAAKALAAAAKVGRAVGQLSVADHVDALVAMAGAIDELAGAGGALDFTKRLIASNYRRYTVGQHANEFGKRVSALEEITARAQLQAQRADLWPVIRRTGEDVREAGAGRSTVAERAPKRNMLAARARAATERIMIFASASGAGEGPLADVVTALGGVTEVTAELSTACEREARLVSIAYESTAVRRRGAAVMEIVAAAGVALELARAALADAAQLADTLRNEEVRWLAGGSGAAG